MSLLQSQHTSFWDLLSFVTYEVVILLSLPSGVFLLCSSVTVDILSLILCYPQTLKMGQASLE